MPKQILIVDDNPIIRRLVRRCVESEMGWHVCGEAENGAMALGMVTDLNPDLVILDFVMPVMDGLEAARRITSMAPNTPVVMFTMQYSQQLLSEARAAGVRDVVSKSDAGTAHLVNSVRSLLNQPSARMA